MKRRMKRHAVVQPLDESYRLIPLTQGQNAIVDKADYLWLSQWNWFAYWSPETRSFYAKRRDGEGMVSMQSFILDCKNGEMADHKNFDTLDNRRENIRPSNRSTNAQHRRIRKDNSSGYKRVCFRGGKWLAHITVKGKQLPLGIFFTPEDAARAYDAAALEHYGEFSQLNFPS
jgi:AP2 domain